MSRKLTTSGKIKKAFQEAGLGRASDWRRLSKETTTEKNIIRLFRNNATQALVEVTENAQNGAFSLRPVSNTLAIETDAEKNKIADFLLDYYHDFGQKAAPRERELGFEEKEELSAKAGKALNNRYCFAFEGDDDRGFMVWITPVAFFDKKGYIDDQTGAIDPTDLCEAAESCWEPALSWTPGYQAPAVADMVKSLLNDGFVWREDFQRFLDCEGEESKEKMLPLVKPLAERLLRGQAPQPGTQELKI